MKSSSPTKVRTQHDITSPFTARTLAEPERAEFEPLLEQDAGAPGPAEGLRSLQHPASVVWRRIQERLFPPDVPEEKLTALGVKNADSLALLDADNTVLWANPAFSEWSGYRLSTAATSLQDLQDRHPSEMQTIIRLVCALKNRQATEGNAILHSNGIKTGSVWIRVVPVKWNSANSQAFLVIGRFED